MGLIAVVLRLECASELLGMLVKTHIAESHNQRTRLR